MKAIVFDSTVGGLNGLGYRLGSRRKGYVRIAASSWYDAFLKLQANIAKWDEIQFWGHGQPGRPLMADMPLTQTFALAFSALLNKDSLVWFRMCSVWYGSKGIEFANQVVRNLGCRVAGHTHVTGFPRQSGLYSVRPGQNAEDIIPLYPDGPEWDKLKSGREQPRTIKALEMSIPEDW